MAHFSVQGEIMAERQSSVAPPWGEGGGRRQRLLLYSPGHRARGKVAREIDLLPRLSRNSDLEFQSAQAVTGEPLEVMIARGSAGKKQLDQVIKIGSRLWLATEPPALSQLIGFDDDEDADPPVALLSHCGMPLATVAERLTGADRLRVAQTLLIALQQLTRARVVHRALSPETVLWDDTQKSVQVVRFAQAAILGEPRSGGPADPQWCAPEQVRGIGQTSTADDLYSAALLLFWLNSREQPAADPASMRERLALQDDELRRRLGGMFDDDPARRATLDQLNRRWLPSPLGRPVTQRREDEAHREFSALRERQFADRTPLYNPSMVVPAPVLTAGIKRVAVAVIAVGVLVIILVVIVVIVG